MFHVITVGRNCQRFVKRWYGSMRKQVVNWRAYVVDDASTDRTFTEIQSLLGDERIRAYKQTTQQWAAKNRWQALQMIKEDYKPDDVVVLLDLDDYLINYGLNKILIHYDQGKKITMGSCVTKNGTRIYQSYSDEAINNRDYGNQFKFPPLRTFRADLAMSLTENDFKLHGDWMKTCTDVAFSLPLLAQCSSEDVQRVKDFIYIYDNSRNDSSQKVFSGPTKQQIYMEYIKRFR